MNLPTDQADGAQHLLVLHEELDQLEEKDSLLGVLLILLAGGISLSLGR